MKPLKRLGAIIGLILFAIVFLVLIFPVFIIYGVKGVLILLIPFKLLFELLNE